MRYSNGINVTMVPNIRNEVFKYMILKSLVAVFLFI
ncbi:hypothetical protein FHW89_003735 [Mucilaginibacter sp. SG564]|nr:hypothetical protein [Mucilaginibacter sp. SG564]